jgi:dTDP-glucose pyrophosphorylase
MTNKINVVIPMAGLGSRFSKAGYLKPKPFIDVNGIPMIEHVINNLNVINAQYILIGRKEHLIEEAELVNYLIKKYDVKIIQIDKTTEGSACTVLFSINSINNSSPLLIANSDQLVDIDINIFINDCINRKLDGSILCFKDVEKNVKWSFARIDKNDLVDLVKEKEAISDYATVGVYFFSKGSSFVQAALEMIINQDRVNGEYYTCPVYNYLINSGKKIGIFNIEVNKMHGLGTPEDLVKFLNLK